MSIGYLEFASDALAIWNKYPFYANRAADWATILAGVTADARTHDKTIQNPAAALSIGASQTNLENALSLLVNRGLAGNMLQSQMVSAIGAASGTAEAPGEIRRATIFASASPPIVGTTMTVLPGTWAGAPTSRTYQWTRDGANIATATATTYVLVSADTGGHAIRCVESAVNATGTSVGKPSLPIQVP